MVSVGQAVAVGLNSVGLNSVGLTTGNVRSDLTDGAKIIEDAVLFIVPCLVWPEVVPARDFVERWNCTAIVGGNTVAWVSN